MIGWGNNAFRNRFDILTFDKSSLNQIMLNSYCLDVLLQWVVVGYCRAWNVWKLGHFRIYQPNRMAEWVKRLSPVLGDREIRISRVRTLVESNQWLKTWYLLLRSQALDTIRIRQGLVHSVSGQCDWVWYVCHGAGGLVSQWGSTIKSPWVCTLISRYLSWCDLQSY